MNPKKKTSGSAAPRDAADDVRPLEEAIGHVFADRALLARALTAPACRMDRPDAKDNQRLEFLGDAVFGLLSADAVFAACPDEQEGALTVRRAHLVSGAALAAVAERIGLRRHLRLNAGAQELPRGAKVLADALEAVMGAVWLDGGLTAARAVFARLKIETGETPQEWAMNPKGRLQVLAQAMRPSRHPVYELLATKGPDHAPEISVRVTVEGVGTAEAMAGSRRAAEALAAATLLKTMENGKEGGLS